MPAPTYAERLAEVQTAIMDAYRVQSYSVGGRSVSRQDLSKLQEEERRLLRLVALEQGAPTHTLAGFRPASGTS